MTVAARTPPGRHGRLRDRSEAGEILRPLIRRASPAHSVIVGIGVAGLAVASKARSPRSPVGAIAVEEFDLPDAFRPGASSGAVSATGRFLLRASALERMAVDPGHVRKAVRDAQFALGTGLLPGWYAGPAVDGRHVVLVDDGGSSSSALAAAIDFIRRDEPLSVTLAVACAPLERIRDMEKVAGELIVGVVPTWTEWFGWHGEIYESDRLPAYSEIGRLLRV